MDGHPVDDLVARLERGELYGASGAAGDRPEPGPRRPAWQQPDHFRRAHAHGTERPGLRPEFPYGTFERAFTLPTKVDTENITSRYDNGMLELTLPLSETDKPRRIAIGTAAPAGDGSAALVA